MTAQAAAITQRQFNYYGLSRVNFPRLYGSFLMRGQFRPFMEIATPAFPIPALAEGYVPQGMAYSEALGSFILTFYYPGYERPSLLAIVDAESGQFVKQLHMLHPNGQPYKGHAGGAAAWGEHVWVTSNAQAHRLCVEDLRQASDRGTVQFRDTFRVGNRGGIAFAADNMLWVGDFYRDGRINFEPQYCPVSGNHAWLTGFRLSESAAMGVIGLSQNGESPAPNFVVSIPDHAQGATLATTGEFMLSTSYSSRRPSYLWVFPSLKELLAQEPARHVTVNGHDDIPLWIISNDMVLHKQIMPSMSEGITQRNGDIYVNFESAALLYRERALLFSDHVVRMPEHELIPEM